jgi:hypothetical protein
VGKDNGKYRFGESEIGKKLVTVQNNKGRKPKSRQGEQEALDKEETIEAIDTTKDGPLSVYHFVFVYTLFNTCGRTPCCLYSRI